MKKHLELFSGTHSFGKESSKLGYEVYSLDRDIGGECPLKSGYKSEHHFKEDIMTWNYKQFPKNYFDLITASPVCLWWSRLRNTWIGRKMKSHGDTIITQEILQQDIDNLGKPMVDKVFEIIEYFEPNKWILENPKTSKMKYYIEEKYPQYNNYKDADYCKYSDWGYRKSTRFWHKGLDNFVAKTCKNDCENMVTILVKEKEKKQHKVVLANGYEMIDGKKVLCNTKEKRDELRQKKVHKKIADGGGDKRRKHKKDSSRDYGGGTNRLERYRIPEKLIVDMIKS